MTSLSKLGIMTFSILFSSLNYRSSLVPSIVELIIKIPVYLPHKDVIYKALLKHKYYSFVNSDSF